MAQYVDVPSAFAASAIDNEEGGGFVMKNATAILCADLHLRDDQPICRSDNYFLVQAIKIGFIRELQCEHGCPVIVAGDIFHKSKPSPFLLAWAIENLPNNMIVIPGQHDLPSHNLDLIEQSGLHVLEAAGRVILTEGQSHAVGDPEHTSAVLYGYPYGAELRGLRRKSEHRRIAVCHTLTWKKEKPFPGCQADSATKLLKKLNGFDLVVVGDNHQSFAVTHEGRFLINPGSMMRMTADQKEHKPRVYLWDAETNETEAVFLPIEKGVISRQHIDAVTERDERIDAFVTKLDSEFAVGLSYEKNMEEFFGSNKVNRNVKQLIMEAME